MDDALQNQDFGIGGFHLGRGHGTGYRDGGGYLDGGGLGIGDGGGNSYEGSGHGSGPLFFEESGDG